MGWLVNAGVAIVGAAATVAAAWFSYVAVRRQRPSLSVTANTGLVLMSPDTGVLQPAVVVEVANDGGADAQINGVSLSGGQLVGQPLKGPKRPTVLRAHGGKAIWVFDFADLRAQLDEQVRTQLVQDLSPRKVQATVRTGSRVLAPDAAAIFVRPSGTHGSLDTDPAGKRYRRLLSWWRAWTRPGHAMIDPILAFTYEDVEAREVKVVVSNRYRRRAAPRSYLVLTVKHADGTRELVSGQPPIPVPRVPGLGSVKVGVPMIDYSTATGDEFTWVHKVRDAYRSSVPAVPLSARAKYMDQFEETPRRSADPAQSGLDSGQLGAAGTAVVGQPEGGADLAVSGLAVEEQSGGDVVDRRPGR